MEYFDLPLDTNFLISAKGRIFRNGKMLLLKGVANDEIPRETWEVPGGLVDIDETPEEALRREVFEETGLNVSVGKVVKVYTTNYDNFTFRDGRQSRIRLFVIVYDCTFKSGNFELSEEHVAAGYFKPSEIKKLLISPHNLEAVQV